MSFSHFEVPSLLCPGSPKTSQRRGGCRCSTQIELHLGAEGNGAGEDTTVQVEQFFYLSMFRIMLAIIVYYKSLMHLKRLMIIICKGVERVPRSLADSSLRTANNNST
jgi:hypothetical protein